MRLPGRRKATAAARWLRSRLRSRALILGYHRIAEGGPDPYDLAVSPDTFRRQMETVRRVAHPVRLGELVRALGSREVPRGAVAVTFDDAHAHTMRTALPVLREHGVPATVFVPTDLMGEEAWWDRLARAVMRADGPIDVDLRSGGTVIARRLSGRERGATGAGARDRLVLDLYDELRPLPAGVRSDLLDALDAWAGGGVGAAPAADRVASPEELVDLAADPLLDVGSHSASHPLLARLPEPEQRREVEESRRRLRDLGLEATLFSYPNGSVSSITERCVRSAGYVGACASQVDVVTSTSDPLRLPRYWPRDELSTFTRVLRAWLGTRG